MYLRTAFAVLALSLAPVAAAAACAGHQDARMSCAQGTTWDETSKSCVTSTS